MRSRLCLTGKRGTLQPSRSTPPIQRCWANREASGRLGCKPQKPPAVSLGGNRIYCRRLGAASISGVALEPGQRLCWGNLAHTWGGSRKQHRGQHPAEPPRRRAQTEPWPLAPAIPLTLPSVGICFISESTAEASARRACSRACSLASGKQFLASLGSQTQEERILHSHGGCSKCQTRDFPSSPGAKTVLPRQGAWV